MSRPTRSARRIALAAALSAAGGLGCTSRAVVGDGTASVDAASAPDVCSAYAAWQARDSTKGVEVSGGGLAVEYRGIGGGAARSDEARSSGRWYWEITIERLADGRRHALGVINGTQSLAGGLFAAAPVLPICRYDPSGDAICGPPTWRSQQFPGFRQGDVVGVALDLDRGILFFSNAGRWEHVSTVNGQTLVDDPVAGAGGLVFPMKWPAPLHAAAEVGPGDRFVANFGGSAFRHTPPSGFSPMRHAGCR